MRQKELDAGARMKARELVFNHYQKKLDRLSAATDHISKSLAEMQVQLHEPDMGEPGPTLAKFANSLVSIALMAKHEAEGIEDELKAFGLHKQYEQELTVLEKLSSGSAWQLQGTFEQKAQELQGLLYSLVLIQEALLEARMKDLFSEYLPTRRTLNLNS